METMDLPIDLRRRFPRPRPPKDSSRPKPGWGWLEWFPIAQTFIPALLFVPGIAFIRTPVRVASYGIGLVAWAMLAYSGRSRSGSENFGANLWLKFACGWLLLLIFNPSTNSLLSGFAHAMLYISILSPAFWTHSAVVTHGQLTRMMVILFLCNGLSALVGVGQVFRPNIFNPPVIAALTDENSLASLALTYTDAHGNKIARPCGLTDQVGAAAGAGAMAALMGVSLALRPIGLLRRLICLMVAFFGVAAIYYSQVRMALLMLVICLITLGILFLLQRKFWQATQLGGLSVGLIVVAFIWVATTSGDIVTKRFLTLLDDDPLKTYQGSRGGFVKQAFEQFLWEYPVGVGLGWWGQIYQFFSDKTVPTTIWVEVMWPAWILDGGFPLLLFYNIAIGFAMLDSLRITLKTRDSELGFWGAVIFASNLSNLATCFSYVTFVSGIGMQFWFLAAALHAADLRSRSNAARSKRPLPGNTPRPGPSFLPLRHRP
jgi:hypothetical protein